ncbi:hypothetical protein F511_16524 [Dorcoceras hygrometricum]|uniref:Uncharacterized protein n=1 Tax=Dorcoceras hygrometricum TaxID=472368 RepID=A0A2Z7BDP5_9LAMI|nr:hypothetical protein F511_16524 [Dorcoceras hygrometricum]
MEGRPPARLVRAAAQHLRTVIGQHAQRMCTTMRNKCARSSASVRNVCAPSCATCVHGYRPACATCAHHRAQHVRTVTGQRARQARNGRRDVRVGCTHDPVIPYVICARRVRTPCTTCARQRSEAPGSDQFHEEIGTSTVGGFGLLIWSTTGIPISSPICTRKLDEIPRTESPRRNGRNKISDGGGGGRRRRRGRRGEE